MSELVEPIVSLEIHEISLAVRKVARRSSRIQYV
jgi:hypothetical protein